MISENLMLEYKKRVGPGLRYAEPSDALVIDIDNGLPLLVPSDETDASFRAKIDAYASTGKNVFLKAYQRFDPYSDKSAIY